LALVIRISLFYLVTVHRAEAVARANDGAPTENDYGVRSGTKIVRMAWTVMARGERYKKPTLLMAALEGPAGRSETPIGEGMTT